MRFKLTLSKSATTTLKKTKRLVLTVKLVFKPRKGKTVTRTVRVTLRKLPKLKQTSPHKPHARVRRRVGLVQHGATSALRSGGATTP